LADRLSLFLTDEDNRLDSNNRPTEPLWHNRVSSLVRDLRKPQHAILEETAVSGEGNWVLTKRGWDEARSISIPQPTTLSPYSSPAPPAPVIQRDPFLVDPDEIDRALLGHHNTIEALARALIAKGLTPSRCLLVGHPRYDLGWVNGGTLNVAEIKSTTPANQEKQLRLGLGQVLRYRHELASTHPQVTAWLVPQSAPEQSWIDTCSTVGVRIWWPGRPI
jgi:hypothetical protein